MTKVNYKSVSDDEDQSPQNIRILGSRIPRKVVQFEEGLSLKGSRGNLKDKWATTPSINEASSKVMDQYQHFAGQNIIIFDKIKFFVSKWFDTASQ